MLSSLSLFTQIILVNIQIMFELKHLAVGFFEQYCLEILHVLEDTMETAYRKAALE